MKIYVKNTPLKVKDSLYSIYHSNCSKVVITINYMSSTRDLYGGLKISFSRNNNLMDFVGFRIL